MSGPAESPVAESPVAESPDVVESPVAESPVAGSPVAGSPDVAGHAAAAFTRTFGRPPTGVWFAPGRVNLIGEHTDYNDGFVLPFALGQGTVVAAGPATGTRTRAVSTVETAAVEFDPATVEPGSVTGWGAYVAGTVWALRSSRPPSAVAPMDVWIDSDVPSGAGLSSSAALECAVAVAAAELAGSPPADTVAERLRLALVAKRAENEFVGAPTGYMDQMASMLGVDGHALFIDTRSLQSTPVPFDTAAAGLALLVVDSRAAHRHADGEYAARRASCEQAVRELGVPALRDITADDLDAALARLSTAELRRRVRHIVTEDDRVLATVRLLRAGEARAIGPLLTASHASMRDDFEITVPEVDVLVEAALRAGAHGARMTGGGFGGCVIALVDADATDTVAAAMTAAALAAGHRAPVVHRAIAGAGAHRLA
jgi:galactokinase